MTMLANKKKDVIQCMAREFLEYRLGIEASDNNIAGLSEHIIQFEKEVQIYAWNKTKTLDVRFAFIPY